MKKTRSPPPTPCKIRQAYTGHSPESIGQRIFKSLLYNSVDEYIYLIFLRRQINGIRGRIRTQDAILISLLAWKFNSTGSRDVGYTRVYPYESTVRKRGIQGWLRYHAEGRRPVG